MRGASRKLHLAAEPEPSPEERVFLDYVARNPEDTVSVVQQALGLTGSALQRLRKELIRKGFLAEVETRLGKGGTLAKFAIPTMRGFRTLGLNPAGRGGPVHRHFQRLVAIQAAARG